MNESSTGPTAIVDALREWIATAAPGARLPSTRTLVAEHAASPVTVQKALRRLVGLGLVETRPGIGTFVRAAHAITPVDHGWQSAALGAHPHGALRVPGAQRTAAADAIGLHAGYPSPDLLPERLVRAALGRAARSASAMTRAPLAGVDDLRAWFASELAVLAPAGVVAPAARDVLIVPGSQSGLTAVLRSIVGASRPLVVESPTYWGAIVAARQAGIDLVPVASDGHGPDPVELDRVLERTGARAFYAQPHHANPTGASWSPARGHEIAEVVRRRHAFLIEDDWARDLAIDVESSPLAPHYEDGRVIYLRSLTKSVSPALRVGAVVARGPARSRLVAGAASESVYVSTLLQSAALDVVTQPAWRTHLRDARTRLQQRRDLLLGALRIEAPHLHVERPGGGLSLWVRLPDGCDVAAVVAGCELRGLLIAHGDEWFPTEPAGAFVRLSYAGPDVDRFVEAARILGEVTAP